jgi:U3 small nucleolar RNA-associated protein 14
MPGRQAHGGLPSAKTSKPRAKNNAKSKKRSLNAYAIAAQENPEKVKIRQHRLGESEGRQKRQRDDEDSDEEEDNGSAKKARKSNAKRRDDSDVDEGSDSDGNEWRLGEAGSDDSDLDSDEAFGESDEERFEGYTFAGSTKKSKPAQKPKGAGKGASVFEEQDDSGADSGSDDESLGEDAIDLATMLDQMDEESDEGNGPRPDGEESGSESNDESAERESDDEDDTSVSDYTDENDPEKLSVLQNLITNLPLSSKSQDKANSVVDVSNTPSDFGIIPKTKLTLDDLALPSINDAHIKKSLKLLATEAKADTKSKGISGKLEVPLAKRQQDRLDRTAAYDKTKETLSRWTDTVAHNRRAEHLIFPLPDHDVASSNSNTRLQTTTTAKPFTELEATIQSILEESGLAPTDGKNSEEKLMEFEELEAAKMSVEEVKARRAQLRMARELLFREEARSRRIKKIKSKSYRRVHRKQREKEERQNAQAMLEAGVEPSEDEQDLRDRRRAEERMGAKHRDSRWAKATKQLGRAAWDEDARDDIIDMARREEELRRRVEGRVTKDDDASDFESSDDDSEDSDDEEGGDGRLFKKLERVRDSQLSASGPGSKLANMKFMLKADAARKQENDATVEQIRRELAGESSTDEEEDESEDIAGRRMYGPGGKKAEASSRRAGLREFEEPLGSDAEDDVKIFTSREDQPVASTKGNRPSQANGGRHRLDAATATASMPTSEGSAWSRVESKSDAKKVSDARRRKQKMNSAEEVGELDASNIMIAVRGDTRKKKPTGQGKAQVLDAGDWDSDDDDSGALPFTIKDQELVKRAFAGAEVDVEFEEEKRQTIQDEDEKVIDNTIPGWGSWVGDGLSKKEKRQNAGRFLTKAAGIKEQDRKDAKLDRVIINEKRVKKVSNLI